jgi:hypothetical protein
VCCGLSDLLCAVWVAASAFVAAAFAAASAFASASAATAAVHATVVAAAAAHCCCSSPLLLLQLLLLPLLLHLLLPLILLLLLLLLSLLLLLLLHLGLSLSLPRAGISKTLRGSNASLPHFCCNGLTFAFAAPYGCSETASSISSSLLLLPLLLDLLCPQNTCMLLTNRSGTNTQHRTHTWSFSSFFRFLCLLLRAFLPQAYTYMCAIVMHMCALWQQAWAMHALIASACLPLQ